LGLLGAEEARPGIERLVSDETEIEVYIDGTLFNRRVKDLAEDALKNCRNNKRTHLRRKKDYE
jgi:hypothetical protein